MVRSRSASAPERPTDVEAASDRLAPYVPRLVVDWLADLEAPMHRTVTGTCVFADVSGFTALTERLAANGKAGAEEMGDLLNQIFDPLLTAAYDYGANLVKWGGDAVLLLFDGADHEARAVRAAWEMQATMRRIGKLRTSRGIVKLGMSIGVHSGDFDFLLVGDRYRELIITGPGATATSAMERLAQSGQVMLSPSTAAALPAGCLAGPDVVTASEADHLGQLLAHAPVVTKTPNRTPKRGGVDIGQAFCAPLREHLVDGVVDHEHRHITVGFIQFLGSDELRRELGPSGLATAVRYVIDAVQQAATDNGVTVLSTDVCENGGKIILVAGAPRAMGDEESRVLSTVRRVVRPGGRLALRAGVTRGPVFAGDYGTSYRRVYSVTGDVVNLAARLMARAEPGQVLVMPDVVERSRTRFVSTPVDPFFVKGKAHPVNAMALGDPMPDTVVQIARRMPLIGREAELRILTQAARAATAGRGQVIDLVGPAGIGKSRLLEELARTRKMRVLWADGDIYGAGTPYGPLTRLIRRTLGVREDVAPTSIARTLTELTTGSAPDLLPWLSLIGVVAGVSLPQSPDVDVLDPAARKRQLERATSALFGRLLTMPVLLVVNDLHFMDEASVELVRQLCLDVGDRPWLIVISRRPDVPSPVADSVGTRIALEPLDPSAARQYLHEAMRDDPIGQHRIDQLVERAGGNPLFLRELTAGAHSGTDLDQLPASIEGVIAARIDQLAPKLRTWLRSVAVLGMVIDRALLPGVLDDPDAADLDAEELREFVAVDLDGRLRFAHHLVQQTAYEGLPYRRRKVLHARAAREIERTAGDRVNDLAAVLSLHSARGDLPASAWHYARLAGEIARSNYALPEAAECYERAVAAAQSLRTVSESEVADACLALATIYIDLGEFPASERMLRQARQRLRKDPEGLAEVMLKTAHHRELIGHYREGLSWATRGRTLLIGAQTDRAGRLRAELSEKQSRIRYRQGRYRDAIDWADLAIEEAQRSGADGAEARARETRSAAAATVGLPWQEEDFDKAIALYESTGELAQMGRCYNTRGAATYYVGRWNDAIDHYRTAEEIFHRIGQESGAVVSGTNAAEILVEQGRWDEALPILEHSMQVWEASHALTFLAFGHYLFGRVAAARGDVDTAETEYARARAISAEIGEVDMLITIDAAHAQLQLTARGDVEAALREAEHTLERARRDVYGAPNLAQLLRVRGCALVLLGEPGEGARALRASLDTARQRNAMHEVAGALIDLLRLNLAATPDEARAWFEEVQFLRQSLGIVAIDSFDIDDLGGVRAG